MAHDADDVIAGRKTGIRGCLVYTAERLVPEDQSLLAVGCFAIMTGHDLVMECTGVPQVVSSLLAHVANDSVVCLAGVGVPAKREFDIGAFNRTMVLNNGTVFGTVNANRQHYAAAADALARADRGWLARLITRRVPLADFTEALAKRKGDIKVVIDFTQA